MLVHVVTSLNRHLYSEVLEQFFRIRHDIYVTEKQWRAPSPDGREIDQFDTDDAVYLIGLEGGEIVCGSRFITTERPHLLADVFGHLCTHGIVRERDVAEWTRGFIVPRFRESGGIALKAQSCAAVMDYCLRENIREVGGIQEMYWLPLWKRLGWQVRIIGEPAEIAGEYCVPGFYAVTPLALNNARRWGRLSASNLVHEGPYKPLMAPLLREDVA